MAGPLLAQGLNQRRHGTGLRRAQRCQTGGHAEPVSLRSVLADFPFSDPALHRDLDANDGSKHALQVVGRCVPHLPGLGLRGLVDLGQPRHHLQHARRVVKGPWHAVGVHDCVVPGRHRLAVLAFAGVPVGRHVGLRPAEHHHRGQRPHQSLPHRVGARHVTDQSAVFAAVGVQQERNVVDQQFPAVLHHPGAQRVCAHQRVQSVGVGLFKVGGQIGHGSGFGEVSVGACSTGSHSTSVLTELARKQDAWAW